MFLGCTVSSRSPKSHLDHLAWIAVRGLESKSLPKTFGMLLPLLLVLGWFSTGFIHLARVRSALIDSANPNTSPDRLRTLAHFLNGPEYEIDNRVAKNPNTPDDPLLELANRKDERAKYISDALKANPRYQDLVSDGARTAPPDAESGRRWLNQAQR